MEARAIWKGDLQLANHRVPVKFYSAVEARGVHFRLLHASDNVPVTQQMFDAKTGKAVPREQVQKGYEVEEGVFVLLKPTEIAQTDPKPSRSIAVSTFLPSTAIPPAWFNRPYYLGPDGDEDSYYALAAALQDTDRVGVAQWVMRKKTYDGALVSHKGVLMMLTLHHQDEILALDHVHADSSLVLDPKEVKLAQQLVAALEAPFEPEAYHNEYRERVAKLLQAKAEGGTIAVARAKAKPAVNSLSQALQSSLKAAKEKHIA